MMIIDITILYFFEVEIKCSIKHISIYFYLNVYICILIYLMSFDLMYNIFDILFDLINNNN